jgi:voltage-gated potassium channel
LSFFHAFYFMSYTATTIGFGEIPAPFSDAQRLWVTLCIHLAVVGWSYAILTLLALFQDRAFQDAIATARFAWRVRRLAEPFYVICGCGETGHLLTRALDRRGTRFVVVEWKDTRISELELEDFGSDTPPSPPTRAVRRACSSPESLIRNAAVWSPSPTTTTRTWPSR